MGEIKIKSWNLFDTSVYNNTIGSIRCTVTSTLNSITIEATGRDPYVGAYLPEGASISVNFRSLYIPVKPNTSYTLNMSSAPKCYWLKVDENNISRGGGEINALPFSFATDEFTKYVTIRFGNGKLQEGDSFTFENIQLLEGTYTAENIPEYKPYFLNRPAHRYTNGQWVDIPTHHYTNGRWQGELTSQSPLKFWADGDMLDWRIEGNTSGNLYPIEMKDDAWTSFRGGRIISRSDNVLQVLTTDSEQSSGVYAAASSILCQLSTLSDTVSMSADICCDNPDAKISIGFETDGKLLYITTITSDFQHYEVTNFTFSKLQSFIVYCANKQAANIYIKNLMINLGSTALPYEPYGGVGDWDETAQRYKIPVTVEGENLFDGELEQGSLGTSAGQEYPTTTRVRIKKPGIDLQAGTYTIDCVGATGGVVVYVYNKDSSWDKESSSKNWQAMPLTFSLYSEKLVRFAFRKTGDSDILPSEVTDIRLYEGTYTASTLPPYEVNLYTDHQLMDGDSIDFTTDQTQIPIATGNNILTVDTAVQPSKVFVKFEG